MAARKPTKPDPVVVPIPVDFGGFLVSIGKAIEDELECWAGEIVREAMEAVDTDAVTAKVMAAINKRMTDGTYVSAMAAKAVSQVMGSK